jgi:predicted O-linked N-acetylglucosamine transferase (SPINDLY family)
MTVTADVASLSLTAMIAETAGLSAGGQAEDAHRLYTTWIAANPDHPQLHIALFNCSALDRQFEGPAVAAAALEKAIARNADFMPAYVNLGRLYEEAGDPGRAIELWRTSVGRHVPINGDSITYAVTALTQIARVLTANHRSEEAEDAIRQCLALNPHQPEILEQYTAARLAQCKWPAITKVDSLERETLMGGINPLSMAAYTDDPLLQLAASYRYITRAIWDGPHENPHDRRHAPIDLSGRRIRVGYVSSDLRDHAIGYLMAELFELHDRSKVEVFAYYCGPESNSALTNRIKSAVEHWVDIREMSDADATARIAQDGIDILVDVNGHTRDSKTGVFARRAAPVQVNWLGYPGSMGSPYHNYIIADEWIIPPDLETYYSEKVVRIPCYQSNDRKRIVAAERPDRANAGLPDNAFVFCCFNGTHKISRFTFERWMEILARTPNSVLWLLDTAENTKAHLRQFAEGKGVAASRIIFAAKMANPLHLARYPLADLFLDSAPYGAHTTASDALWMGVPVLTLSGRSFASRVCGSLTRSAGLPELVCTRAEDYIERAVALAHNRAEVEGYKARLRATRDTCTLFNMDLLTAKLEAVYRDLCEAHQKGQTPRPDLTNLDSYFKVGIAFDHDAQEMLGVADYHGLYRAGLKKLHLSRPLAADTRLWRATDIAAADAPPVAVPALSIKQPSAGAFAMRLLQARMLQAQGKVLECLEALLELKNQAEDKNILLDDVRAVVDPAVQRFNEHAAAGDIEQAARYIDAIVALLPRNVAALNSAISCAVALGHTDKAEAYAKALAVVAGPQPEASPAALESVPAAEQVHPLIQLRDLFDRTSAILCGPLDTERAADIRQLVNAGRALIVPVQPESEWAAWEKHYRLALDAADISAAQAPTPAARPEERTVFATSTGKPLTIHAMQAAAKSLKARTVFFAAADRTYVDLYARAYIRSILDHTDVSSLIVLHVIGGADALSAVAKAVGITSKRLIYAGDTFNASSVQTRCFDAPPKGLSAKPIAHLQSVRFLRLGRMLKTFRLPVFVSDIDLILQRGVKDLLERFSGADLVLNQNSHSENAGSRYTANLLLLNPTPRAAIFQRFLRAYLETALARPEVSRWIDQFGLMQARHHLALHVPDAKIAFFDDSSDINNVMYPSYQEQGFRFLSLYHGFDMSSLPVKSAAAKAPARKPPVRQKRAAGIRARA